MSLDGVVAVVREFLNPNASRSGLDRCLRRHGVGSLRDLKAKDERPKHSSFKAYEARYIQIDVKYLPQMARRFVLNALYRNKTAANARRFLRDLERACPISIRTVLTDNGKECTESLFGLRKRVAKILRLEGGRASHMR